VRAQAFAVALLIGVASLCRGATAQADDFPNGKVRILVPTAAAGVADSMARIIGAKVQESIGQTVYVEDRPGANGNVGAQAALSAPADGYTIMMGHIGLMTINYHLYPKMGFNPVKAFVPVVQVVSYPDVLVVNNDLPVKTFADFIKYAKANPKALTYSSKLKNSGESGLRVSHRKNVLDLMQELLISDIRDNRIESCSGGQIKRICIALELTSISKPYLLFIDEPTTGLDTHAAHVVSN